MTKLEDIAKEPLARAKQLAEGTQSLRRDLSNISEEVNESHYLALNVTATEACAHALIAIAGELRTANLIAARTIGVKRMGEKR